MKNETQEIMEETVLEELVLDQKPSKVGPILLTASMAVSILLFAFRKKIGTKIEKSMVDKLSKKGYMVYPPELEDFSISD